MWRVSRHTKTVGSIKDNEIKKLVRFIARQKKLGEAHETFRIGDIHFRAKNLTNVGFYHAATGDYICHASWIEQGNK